MLQAVSSHPTVPIHPILFYYEDYIFLWEMFVLNILVCFCSPHVWVMPIRDCGRQNVNVPIYPVLGMTRSRFF